MEVDLLMPGLAAKADQFLFGICTLALVRGAGHTLLFDTGSYRARGALLRALAERGLAPGDVDAVFLSHLHWDHALGADLFPEARVFVPRAEYEYAGAVAAGDWGTPPFVRRVLEGLRLELLEDEEAELLPGVRTLRLPGHSVGLQGLAVRTARGVEVLASDAVWSARDALAGRPDLAFHDRDLAAGSLRRALELADVVYPGHDRPFRLRRGRVEFLAEYRYRMRFFLQPAGGDLEVALASGPGLGFDAWPGPEVRR